MMRMTDIPAEKKRKMTPEEEAIRNEAQPEKTLLTLAELPKRRTREKQEGEAERATPQRILTLSDLPKRGGPMRRLQQEAARAVTAKRKNKVWINVYGEETYGPRNFSDFVPNGVWGGRRCFIIGGGPSLNHCDLSGLAGELTIGINRAYEVISPSILYGVDSQLIGWAHLGELGAESMTKFDDYKGYKVWMALHRIFPDDICLIESDSAKGHKIGTTKRLSFHNNSGYGAINLAAALGATQIYLLGFDMHGDKQGKQKWWHDGYPKDYGEGVYKRYVDAITEFAPALKSAGVQVINLNEKSNLRCFPFDTFHNVLKYKPKRPIAVSFYTRETGYERESVRLLRDLHLFGFEHDVVGIRSLGSWQKNTQYKAKFIMEMLEKYPDRDILWLDIDSSIQQYPALFDNAEFDLAACIIDWREYSNSSRTDKQLANGVIYLKNNAKTRGFVRDWIRLNEANPDRIEMVTMAEVLKRREKKLKFFNLPGSYCQIFDLMSSDTKPVIAQLQASRRYRDSALTNDPIALTEKQKYDFCWTDGYERSQCATPFIDYIKKTMNPGDKVLDIGCGDCTTLLGLRAAGINCTGVDISVKGVPDGVYGVFEAPVWSMPFDDEQFDYTVSTDVLEHIPTEMIPAAIKEIKRVTKRKTSHVIAQFDGIRKGMVLHMTVKPTEWWIEQFRRNGDRELDTKLIPRNVFMGGR